MTAVAAVLSNWHNVLRAIHMASGEPSSSRPRPGPASRLTWLARVRVLGRELTGWAVKIPRPKRDDSGPLDEDATRETEPDVQLPQTLVRIPVGQVPSVQPEGGGPGVSAV